ncbi:Hsp33 family molecular chaperone HslO [Streptomyces griseus]
MNCSIPICRASVLLFRLFHERGVRVYPVQPVKAQCTCSREAVAGMLASFEARIAPTWWRTARWW